MLNFIVNRKIKANVFLCSSHIEIIELELSFHGDLESL